MSETGSSGGPGPPAFDASLIERLVPLLDLVDASPVSLTSIRSRSEAIDVHLRDSLSGLAARPLVESETVIDIGSGGGFPGLPLAMALPATSFTLIDSVIRKAEFIEMAASSLALENVTVIPARSEELAAGSGREAFRSATARAVAPLAALAELASPLLEEGGALIAWKGQREPEQEEALAALGSRISMELSEVIEVVPFEGSHTRNLYVVTKTGPTPEELPRRPGMARKRPLSA